MNPDRFWAKVDFSDSTGCWQWLACTAHGYGRFGVDGRSALAHRVAWALLVGAIPDGMTVDHLCKNRACVNPAHMELVPPGVNALRGNGPAARNARKSQCIRGHVFDDANVYHYKGRRECRACRSEALRAWKARKRSA